MSPAGVVEGEVRERAARLAEDLRTYGAAEARLAFVLGSGLGAFAERLTEAETIPFSVLDEMPRSAVPGHAGEFVLGRLEGECVLVQRGRVHLYEGWSGFEVTRSVRAMASLGIGGLVLTNAAGCLRTDWAVPGLMCIEDHIALQPERGLLGDEARRGRPYDTGFAEALSGAARAANTQLERGVYVGLMGPSYETPSEVRAFANCGAGAVGMSTVAESSVAFALGMRVVALSCLSNLGAGLGVGPLSHDEVVEAGRSVADRMQQLLQRATPEWCRQLRTRS